MLVRKKISCCEDLMSELKELQKRFDAMKPEMELTVRDSKMGVEGYVVAWNTGISRGGPLDGCAKGGTRITPTLDIKQVARLACTMAIKNAAAGLPLGGLKSGLKADPNADDYEEKYRRFVELCAPVLYENGGIFGGFGYDVGGKPPLNAKWACSALEDKKLGSSRSFTGKPVDMGGTDYDNEGIAGLGVAVAAKTMLEVREKPVEGASFAVQGLGAMGAAVFRYFSEFGGKLSAVSDMALGGTWLIEKDIPEELRQSFIGKDFDKTKELLESVGKKLSDDVQDVLYQDVDVLFPCAVEDVITSENAGKIKAPFICEGANNPTTDEAHSILFKARKGCLVPDVIANPGGIIAAFIEMTVETTDEVIKNGTKVKEAKGLTISKVEENTRKLLSMVDEFNVQPDHVGDYMAYSNIFYGLEKIS